MKNNGFTLMELLVVIAVLGILASVILTIVDPAEKIRTANDVKVKNDVRTVANAFESYQTSNAGYYTGASSTSLVQNGYLKLWPSSNGFGISVTATIAHSYGVVTSKSNKGSCTDTMYWTFNSTDGKTYKCCLTGAPVAGTTNPASNGSCTVVST